MRRDFIKWLAEYVKNTGHELTAEQLKEIEDQLKSKKQKPELEQTEFPWKYESLGESTAQLDMLDKFS